jgi:malate synthase
MLWNVMLKELESLLKVPKHSFKVTIIVESLTALLELEEIVFVMRKRIVGLNSGRWNYLASILKRFHKDPASLIKPRN